MSSEQSDQEVQDGNIQSSLIGRQEDHQIDDTHKVIEENLVKSGGFNRYQKFILFFFVLILIEISILMLSATFIYLPPTFICKKDNTKQIINQQNNRDSNAKNEYYFHKTIPHDSKNENSSLNNQNDNQYHFNQQLSSSDETCGENDGGCKLEILEPGQKSTYSIQLDMYCDTSDLRDLASSMLFVGSIFGNILLGIAGDIYGRKRVLQISWFIASLCTIGVAFTYNTTLLMIINFILGFFSWPVLNLLLLILNEETSEQYRQMASLMLMIAWAIGEILLSPLAYLIDDFRNMVIYWIMIPCLALNIPLFFVIESPSYYLSRNNIDSAVESLKKIARFNNKELIIEDQPFGDDFLREKKEEDNLLFNFTALFKYKSLRGITIASCLVMISIQVFYFGCQFALSGVGYNLYINEAVAGAGELITLIIGNFVIPKLKRKYSVLTANILSILICLSYSIIKNSETQTVFIGLLRISNIFQLGIFQCYIPEMYPSQVRSVGAGIIFGLGNTGSVVAPFIVSQANNIGIPEMVFVGIFGVIGLIASIFLKETFNLPLKDQIEELRMIDDNNASIYSPQAKKQQD